MTAVTIQELSQSRNLLNSISEKKASITPVLKNGTSWMFKTRNLPSVSRFKKSLLIYFKTDENSIFDIHNSIGIKFSNRLRLNFSHLNEHKFGHNFRDTVNSFCLCNAGTLSLPFVFQTKNKNP